MSFIAEVFFKYGVYLFTPLHIIVCLLLIAVVLLQSGKGADLAGAFGGGGTQTAFGPRGVENTLSRATKYAAILFMITSLGLSIVRTRAQTEGALGDLPSTEDVKKESATDPASSPTPAASVLVPLAPAAVEATPTP